MKKQVTLNLDVWSGLGDNLQVSTIPRRFYEKFGYKGVYISNSVPWRNKEIKELVWDLNPYIAGFTDKKGVNIADAGLIHYDGATHWIANMEKIYQFSGPFSKKPEIYYDISREDKFNVSNKTIVDLTASNENNTMDKINHRKNMKKYFDTLEEKVTIVRLNNIRTNNTFADYTNEIVVNKNYDYIDINNIYDYCQIIKHCKKYICSFSGNHCLAAAIREDLTCFAPNVYYNMKYFIFESKITYALI